MRREVEEGFVAAFVVKGDVKGCGVGEGADGAGKRDAGGWVGGSGGEEWEEGGVEAVAGGKWVSGEEGEEEERRKGLQMECVTAGEDYGVRVMFFGIKEVLVAELAGGDEEGGVFGVVGLVGRPGRGGGGHNCGSGERRVRDGGRGGGEEVDR